MVTDIQKNAQYLKINKINQHNTSANVSKRIDTKFCGLGEFIHGLENIHGEIANGSHRSQHDWQIEMRK